MKGQDCQKHELVENINILELSKMWKFWNGPFFILYYKKAEHEQDHKVIGLNGMHLSSVRISVYVF